MNIQGKSFLVWFVSLEVGRFLVNEILLVLFCFVFFYSFLIYMVFTPDTILNERQS